MTGLLPYFIDFKCYGFLIGVRHGQTRQKSIPLRLTTVNAAFFEG